MINADNIFSADEFHPKISKGINLRQGQSLDKLKSTLYMIMNYETLY